VSVNPTSSISITASGPLSIPQGANVVLNAPIGTGYIYQWRKDGIVISGAVSSSYTATVGGIYSVIVTDSNLCEVSSQPVEVSVTSARAITKSNISLKVYPNPIVRGEFLNIDRNSGLAGNVLRVTITDIAGRLVYSGLLKPNERQTRIPGKAGVYLVEIRWGPGERKVFRVVKIE
jgi:hypothetical protein